MILMLINKNKILKHAMRLTFTFPLIKQTIKQINANVIFDLLGFSIYLF